MPGPPTCVLYSLSSVEVLAFPPGTISAPSPSVPRSTRGCWPADPLRPRLPSPASCVVLTLLGRPRRSPMVRLACAHASRGHRLAGKQCSPDAATSAPAPAGLDWAGDALRVRPFGSAQGCFLRSPDPWSGDSAGWKEDCPARRANGRGWERTRCWRWGKKKGRRFRAPTVVVCGGNHCRRAV